MLICKHCNFQSHGTCYSILTAIPGFEHTCGSCAVYLNIPCTNEVIRSLYTCNLNEDELAVVKKDFLFKKSAVSYLRHEHIGYIGSSVPKEEFLQSRFDINKGLAEQMIGRLCGSYFITFIPNHIYVDADLIRDFFKLNGEIDRPSLSSSDLQSPAPKPVQSEQNQQDVPTDTRSRHDSGYNDDRTSFDRPLDDNTRYNEARPTTVNGPYDDVMVSRKVFPSPRGGYRKYISFTPEFYNAIKRPGKVWRSPAPVHKLVPGEDSVPLYGELTHMVGPTMNTTNDRFNMQLLFTWEKHAVACRLWGDTEEQLTSCKSKLELNNFYIMVKYTAVGKKLW